MSDFRAIGGVSATLQTLLGDRMEWPDGIASAPITIGPPPFSTLDVNPRLEPPRVNLFLYRVTENGFLQNQEIPGRGTGSGFGHPPLSLNLHYLLTAYGNEELVGQTTVFDDSHAQFLLGSAMRVLHDLPAVTPNFATVRPPSGVVILHESLRDDFEQVKTTLEPLTLDDLSKIWTALGLRMRLGASYVVNVVQIESRRRRTFPRPVGQPASPTMPPLPTDAPAPGPMIYVFPIQTPTITDVRVRRPGDTVEQSIAYARIGDTLVLRGTSIFAPITSVGFGDVEVPASFAGPDRVEAVVPDATIAGLGPIPPERQLQPGVRTARIILRDPMVPGARFSSNEAPFMLVPAVNPATLVYAAGPPRTLTIQGTRLIGTSPGGETVIGRASIVRAAYASAAPTQITVPIPDLLPARDVHLLLGGPLPDPITLGPGAQILQITIGGVLRTATANLSGTIARSSAAAIVAALIHDALPTDPHFTGARVDLWHDRLLVVPGGLVSTVTITSPSGLTFAADLGLTAAQPPGATAALVSGSLASPLLITAPAPQVRLTIGAQPPITVPISAASSLAALADSLQATITGIGGPAEYLNAQVAVTGDQLLVIPGAAGTVVFDATPADSTTAGQLQLRARFAVRVRVNNAESIDQASVELPQ
jgi:Pvc16 N-terminal domain